RNLVPWPQAQVVAASAVDATLPPCDAIYVNAGATHPPDAWLDALVVAGRLVLPLTDDEGSGAMLMVTRRASAGFAARFLCRVAFIACLGAHDAQAARALGAALRSRPLGEVRSLVRH